MTLHLHLVPDPAPPAPWAGYSTRPALSELDRAAALGDLLQRLLGVVEAAEDAIGGGSARGLAQDLCDHLDARRKEMEMERRQGGAAAEVTDEQIHDATEREARIWRERVTLLLAQALA